MRTFFSGLHEPKGDVTTTVPVVQQRDRYNWMGRHYSILQHGAGKHFRRVLIGDSITHYWGGVPGATCQRGVDSWSQLKGETVNMGCGYDRIENVLWRIYQGELDNLTADKLYLLIGTNNLSVNTDEEIVEGIRAVINAVRVRLPETEVTVVCLLPRRDKEERVRNLNVLISQMAKNEGVVCIDPGQKFLGDNGKIDESLFEDGLHPNASGYRMLLEYYQ